uniref:hypothetical protein n=1 Tax=Yoonia sp. TaxID=2212373 RepID=UPI004047BED6
MTLRFHGFIRYDYGLSLKSAMRRMPNCTVAITKEWENEIGLITPHEFTQRGKRPKSACTRGTDELVRWDEIRKAAEEGRFEDIIDRVRFRHHDLIQRIRRDFLLALESTRERKPY